ARRDVRGGVAIRRRAHNEFWLSARSESLSSRKGDVGGRQSGEAGRDNCLRRRMPRRSAITRILRRGPRFPAVAVEVVGDDSGTRVLQARPVAGTDPGADPVEGGGDG